MNIKKLNERSDISANSKAIMLYKRLGDLLRILEIRELPDDIVDLINQEIEQINSFSGTDKHLIKMIKAVQNKIIKLLENRLKIVPEKYYSKLWTVLGMVTYGCSLGVIVGAITGKMAFLSIGMAVGMAIGMSIGARMDKKAYNEGRQLEIEI